MSGASAVEIIARVADRDPTQIAADQQLVGDLGFDSARALELLVELEEGLGVELAEEDVASLITVGDVLAAVGRAVGGG